ncbi:MAG TPA: MBL fold metallo-hydrolase [Rhodobacteraceae bacterium]|nr:MBL fold metallo-hydrolase [Paracoccaceae bacterium]
MSDTYRYTILGCGSSAGVPRIGNDWGACDPQNPKNRRRRCSMLVERVGQNGTTRALIDTGPDLREQLLSADVSQLDGVVYTHSHADHVHGVDDLRVVVYNLKTRLKVYADGATANALIARFGYVFVQPAGSAYPPILDLINIDGPVSISGAGGDIVLEPFTGKHGRIDSLGFRIGGLAYLPDVSEMYDKSWEAVQGLDIWVLDALRREPHPTHAHLARSLEWIERAAPKQAVLTNMHIDLDYEAVKAETPANVTPAYDGMVLSLPA